MPRGAAYRDDRLQDAAGTLGQRPNPDVKENLAPRFEERRTLAHQARSLVPPHRQHQLPADDRPLGAAHAGNGHPLLSGLVPDAAHRSAALHGLDLLHLVLLPGVAEGAIPAPLVSNLPLSALPDVAWHWAHHHQHARRYGSSFRHPKFLQAHTEISRAEAR